MESLDKRGGPEGVTDAGYWPCNRKTSLMTVCATASMERSALTWTILS